MTLVLLGDQSPKVHRNSSLHDKPMSNIESLFHYCSFLSIDFIWFHSISFDFIINIIINVIIIQDFMKHFSPSSSVLEFQVGGDRHHLSPRIFGLAFAGPDGELLVLLLRGPESPRGVLGGVRFPQVSTGFDMFRHGVFMIFHDSRQIRWIFTYISHRILAYFSSIYFHHKSLKFGALLSFVPADKWTSGASLRQLLTFGWWILSWPSRWHWRIKTIAGVVFDLTCAPWLHELDDKRECMKTWVSMHPTSFW